MHIVMGNAATLDVKYLWLRLLKRVGRFAVYQVKRQKQPAGA
jgi:hypothetical protein